MSSALIQLLVLAGIAVFLILKLRSVLGTRDGFEKQAPAEPPPQRAIDLPRSEFTVIEGGPDRDIVDQVPADSPSAKALTAMKKIEPSFSVSEFLRGARGAYEMILMAFQGDDLDKIKTFLAADVHDAFAGVVADRKARGLKIEATFVGIRELSITGAEFDGASKRGEISVRFLSEQTSVVRDAQGAIVEGNPNEIVRQRDVWTFARTFGSADPNWQLVATGE